MCRIEWRTNDLANTLVLAHTLRKNFNLALTDPLYLPDLHNQCVDLWPVPIPCPCSCRPGCARRHETHRRTGKTHRSTAHSWCRCHSIGGIEPIHSCQRLAHIPGGRHGPEMVFCVSGCQGMGAELLHQFVHACAPRANASPIKWLSPPSGKLGRQPQYTVTQRPCRASAAYTSRRSCAVVASLQHWAAQQILVLHPRRIMLPPRR